MLAIVALVAASEIPALAQTLIPPPSTQPPPIFEVAAIKLTDLSGPRGRCFMQGQPGGKTFIGRCMTLRELIKYAYKITDSQISGGPAWIDNELYDFDAKADRTVTRAELGAMFAKLIVDRFKLQFHIDKRTMPALVLTLDKGGQKMTPNTTDYEWEIPVVPVEGSRLPKFKGTRCPLYYLAWFIGRQENRPVVDQTGLTGFWDFNLEYVPEGAAMRGPTGEAPLEGPSLVTALKEQLGLKLTSEKAPVDVYVIDHVEKAGAN
jgi:uncharacterized protein (TIGR03435 family)